MGQQDDVASRSRAWEACNKGIATQEIPQAKSIKPPRIALEGRFVATAVLGIAVYLTAYTIRRSSSFEINTLSRSRLVVSVLVSIGVSWAGLRRGSLSPSGALVAAFVGVACTVANLGYCTAILTFFVIGSVATKANARSRVNSQQQQKQHVTGGNRIWVQVICNSAIVLLCSLLQLATVGPGNEATTNQSPYSLVLRTASVAAIASCTADTVASELAPLLGRGDPVLITRPWTRVVPVGTNGGVTAMGVCLGVPSGAIVGLAYSFGVALAAGFACINGGRAKMILLDHHPLSVAASVLISHSLFFVPLGAAAGVIGSLLDSLLGATVQFSGFDRSTGTVVNVPGPAVDYISGKLWVDNHVVNLFSSAATALATGSLLWLYSAA